MASESMSISDKGSYLLVEFFGRFSVEAGKQCVDEMVEASQKNDRSKVLLDCRRMTGSMPVIDRFEVAEYGAIKGRVLMQLALLNREDVVLPDNFVENVAVNRGMRMKVFTDFDEAVLWLTSLAPNKPHAGDGE
jgi:hypothetical protein